MALGLLLLALVAAGTGWAVSYRPIIVKGPTIAASWSGVSGKRWPQRLGMKLHIFNTGINWVSPLLVGNTAKWRAVPAFVIEHPSRGLVVFDCGLSEAIAARGDKALPWSVRLLFRSRGKPGRLLDQQMQRAGLMPGKVKTVVLSHLHFDHVGRAAAFTNATFFVGEGARSHDRSTSMGFAPQLLAPIPAGRWRTLKRVDARPYATFDRAIDLFGDQSIFAIMGGGHAHNDLGLLIMLPKGPVLLAGDMVVHRQWLASDDVQRIAAKPQRAAAVRNQIRALLKMDPSIALIPGHDLQILPNPRPDIIQHHPAWFSPKAWDTTP